MICKLILDLDYIPIYPASLQGKKFLTGDEASVADAMTALELVPILNWAATERCERLREWHATVFNLEAVKESGISPLDERLSKPGTKIRRCKDPVVKVQGIQGYDKRLIQGCVNHE